MLRSIITKVVIAHPRTEISIISEDDDDLAIRGGVTAIQKEDDLEFLPKKKRKRSEDNKGPEFHPCGLPSDFITSKFEEVCRLYSFH